MPDWWDEPWGHPGRTVGAAIPTIPPRAKLLERALDSVFTQTRPVNDVQVCVDTEKLGAAACRNRAWRGLSTDYVAFLDDDDEWEPTFVERLLDVAVREDAEMVYPGFTVVGGTDPFPGHFGRPWDPQDPRQTTIACLWKREALEAVGGFPEPDEDVDPRGNRVGEDYLAVLALNDLGGKIVHVPERLFRWHHHARNTSGRPSRW